MKQYQPTPDFYHDYIAHHGILGMSWGERNGPPYPLDSDVSTGHRLKKGRSATKKKPRIATSVSIMEKDIKKGDREFTKDQLNMLTKAKLTDEAYKSPGFIQWLNETDPELKKYDPTKHEETVKRFRKETTPEFRREGENRVDTKQSKHDQKLQKEHDKNVKKAERDFQETHKLFTTSDGRSWYVRKNLTKDDTMKDGMSRYQTLSLKGKNGSTDHYHIDRKYNVVVEKTTTDRNDNRTISSFDKNDKDLIAKLRKQQQKQWDRERW